MATLDELEKAIRVADAAGRKDDVRALGAEYQRLSQPKITSENYLPDAQGNAERIEYRQPAPAPSMADRAIGAGEAALAAGTGMTGGMAGYMGGTVGGLVDSVRGGTFGTPQGGQDVKRSAEQGAANLTFMPRTSEGQKYAQGLATAGQAMVPLTPMMMEAPAALRGLRAGMEKRSAARYAEPLRTQSKQKQAIGTSIQETPRNPENAPFKITEAGKVAKDSVAAETLRQGFDEGVIATVKDAAPADVGRIGKMVDILKQGTKDAKFRMENRATDVVGDVVSKMVSHVADARRKAGKQLNVVAEGLKGQKVDSSPILSAFQEKLSNSGVKILTEPDTGKQRLSFKGSDFYKLKGSENAIKSLAERMKGVDLTDARELHGLKKYIYETVSYGNKSKSGMTPKAERMLKGLARDINETLASNFDDYAAANKVYSSSSDALEALQKGAGTSIDLEGASADKALGTSLRRLLGNTQSRVSLGESIKKLQQVVKETGGAVDGDVGTLAMVADELDRMFGTTATTSFKGQINQALKTGVEAAKGRSLTGLAIDAAGEGINKARGINDKAALSSMEEVRIHSRALD